jgi:hypothetical protein
MLKVKKNMEILYPFTWLLFAVAVIAFCCEFFDSSLGMGYGTTLTPVLLFMGFEPLQIVPSLLLSQFIAGLISALSHSLLKNMTLGFKKNHSKENSLGGETSIPSGSSFANFDSPVQTKKRRSFFSKLADLTTDTKVVLILTFFGILGTLISTVLSAYFSYGAMFNFGVKIYIGLMVLLMGILIFIYRRHHISFSFKKIIFLGGLAGFNKGISGGGFGPLTVSGQILSGREGKSAIASTAFSEGLICFVGVLATLATNLIASYYAGGPPDIGDWGLAPYLIIGSVLSAPLAALITKKIETDWLTIIVATVTVLLGSFTIIKTILNFTGLW